MNILHLTSHLNAGGITSYLLHLLPEQKKAGHHIAVWGAQGDRLKDFQSIADEVFDSAPRTKSELSPRLWLAFPGLLSVLKEQSIDVMHAHTRVTQVLAAAASAITKIPVATTAHGFYKPRIGRQIFPCWGSVIFAISAAVRNGLIKTFSANRLPEIKVVPNGIDTHELKRKFDGVDREEIRKTFGFLDSDLVVTSISRLRPSKGIHCLASAFGELVKKDSNFKLLIVGGGDEVYRNELEAQVRELKIESYVKFLGNIKEIEEPLKAADIFAAPNFSPEGFGLSVLEAMSCGLPIIASSTEGFKELLNKGEYGLIFEERDSLELMHGLQRYGENQSFRSQMANKALEASRNYSSERVADMIQEGYERVITGEKE